MYVVKIGGSLITHKDEYCSPNLEEIRRYAKVVKKIWEDIKGNLIIVLGGGSYGNGVPIRYNIKNSDQPWDPLDLQMMTIKMFEWISLVCRIFREEGIPCYPFQASSYCTTKDGDLSEYNIAAIKECLKLNILPITSGDLTFDKDKIFVIYSSDNIPEVFARSFRVKRVVTLTDVDGIYTTNQMKDIIKLVNKDNYREILNLAGDSNKQDVTGGMKNKLRALIRIAALGTECVICSGKDPMNLIPAIYSQTPPGTFISAWECEGSSC
ncbi:isopentenyl phosphate kinase [Fervidibacillus albus]|uniref:Isopentenyl phosphate kinase n=1 Tax=Fervidibacillus albus TaxID=2980026 RepID=A0A9E8LT73_9BACI|nr:isopentenyl phosphate kinase [Fervidibacillus albus]WAA09173.1 isopentenyl phosphate kinase [Fervidibacillus albus]